MFPGLRPPYHNNGCYDKGIFWYSKSKNSLFKTLFDKHLIITGLHLSFFYVIYYSHQMNEYHVIKCTNENYTIVWGKHKFN